ncbi:hypothetical protein KAU45_01565, partial [bacterium]|nr:hypothetical protein [bacterium]
IIPIENSLLYVEPVYIQAEVDAIPELKYILLAYGNQIAMDETLDGALDKLFGPAAWVEETVEPETGEVVEVETGEPVELVAETAEETEPVVVAADLTELRSVAREFDAAWVDYNEARAARDWTAFDRAERRIEELLDRLETLAGAP